MCRFGSLGSLCSTPFPHRRAPKGSSRQPCSLGRKRRQARPSSVPGKTWFWPSCAKALMAGPDPGSCKGPLLLLQRAPHTPRSRWTRGPSSAMPAMQSLPSSLPHAAENRGTPFSMARHHLWIPRLGGLTCPCSRHRSRRHWV